MTTKTDTLTANPKFYVGNDNITELVAAARSLWRQGENNRLELGEQFSKLRAEVEKYQRNNKGLSYRQAVAQTGVPWSTAERYREMFELVTELTIPADVFLLLCEEGANIADIKSTLGDTFKASIKALLPRITALDVTNAKAVADVADDLNKLIPKSFAKSDPETLKNELGALLAELPKAKTAVESLDLAAAIHQKQTEISESNAQLMKGLVHGLAPFVRWSQEKVRSYLTKFADQPLSLQTKLLDQATTFAKNVVSALETVKEADA